MKKIKKKYLCIIPLLIIIILGSYLAFHSPKIMPQKWIAENSCGYSGVFSQNNQLDQLLLLDISPYVNPETILYHDNWLYASVDGGIIIRFHEDGSNLSEIINTGGAIIGFDFDSKNNIIFADAAFDSNGGAICIATQTDNYQITPLITEYHGTRLMFPDAVAIDQKDNIYFTDACAITAAHHNNSTVLASNIDHIAHTKTGTLYRFSYDTNITECIASGFSFANGIVVSQDQNFIILSETSEYRIWKIDSNLRNAHPGDPGTELLIDNLPGFPDNLSVNDSGNIWVGLVSPRSEFIDSQSNKTFIRKILLNLPDTILAQLMNGEQYSHAFCMTESGKIIADYQTQNKDYTNITGVCETTNTLFFESICGKSKIGYIQK